MAMTTSEAHLKDAREALEKAEQCLRAAIEESGAQDKTMRQLLTEGSDLAIMLSAALTLNSLIHELFSVRL